MRKTNKIKKVTFLAASLAVTVMIPTSFTQAASLNSGSATGMVNSIFNRVGLEQKQNSSTPSSNVQQAQDANINKNINSESSLNSKPESSSDLKQSNINRANKIIKTGEKYLGTPYKFGSSSNTTRTFDCSSFVQRVYAENGIKLPRNSRQQSKVGTTVPKSQLQKGDLIFFKTKKSNGRVAHVGIYAGNNKILHTWGPGGVKYESLNTPWLKQGYLHAKRVIK